MTQIIFKVAILRPRGTAGGPGRTYHSLKNGAPLVLDGLVTYSNRAPLFTPD